MALWLWNFLARLLCITYFKKSCHHLRFPTTINLLRPCFKLLQVLQVFATLHNWLVDENAISPMFRVLLKKTVRMCGPIPPLCVPHSLLFWHTHIAGRILWWQPHSKRSSRWAPLFFSTFSTTSRLIAGQMYLPNLRIGVNSATYFRMWVEVSRIVSNPHVLYVV